MQDHYGVNACNKYIKGDNRNYEIQNITKALKSQIFSNKIKS